VALTETLILVISLMLGYALASKNVRSAIAYVLAFVASLLIGAVISWMASPFMAITVITTTDLLISAAIIAIIGMCTGIVVAFIVPKLTGIS